MAFERSYKRIAMEVTPRQANFANFTARMVKTYVKTNEPKVKRR